MAAQAILVSGTTEILKKLTSTISQQISLAWGVKDALKKLQRTLEMILAVIADAEEKQVKDNAVRLWLRRLKDVAYEADDILDEFSYEVLRHKTDTKNLKIKKVTNFFSRSNPLVFHFKMSRKIKDINQKMDEFARDTNRFQLQMISLGSSQNTSVSVGKGSRETFSFVDDSKIVGRESDKSKIIDMLLMIGTSSGQEIKERVPVIPIVGMGGLGKTTLAQSVCNDDSVQKYFDFSIWVYVSEKFDVKKILLHILESVTGNKSDDVSNMDVMVRRLHGNLSGKKYLLVLDDLWNENYEEWEKLKGVLEFGADGSTVLVTTRSHEVARIVGGKLSAYELKRLSEDDCWTLFKQRAFGTSSGAVETPSLVTIGKELVKKCGGLPLAAKTLGSLMGSKKEECEWFFIHDDEIWDQSQENEGGVLPALRLSYDHLSSHLKQCFSYCSIFPKGCFFPKEKLIQLWMAEGFLQSYEGINNRLMLEDIGNEHFNSLLQKSFFQDLRKNEHGDIVGGKMHDLVHDLGRAVVGTEISILKPTIGEEEVSEILRLRLVYDNQISVVPKSLCSAKRLRTMFAIGAGDKTVDNLSKNKRLRVLDLSYSNIERLLSPSIGKLKHLRYLNLSGTKIDELPKPITNLYNLQTLNLCYCHQFEALPMDIGTLKHLRYLDLTRTRVETLPVSITSLHNLRALIVEHCHRLKEFPENMNKLINLRHLIIDDGGFWTAMPSTIGELSCLQTLPIFKLAKDSKVGIKELELLNFLKGKLEIVGLENVIDGTDAQLANLKGKQNIHHLKLCWGNKSPLEIFLEKKKKTYVNLNVGFSCWDEDGEINDENESGKSDHGNDDNGNQNDVDDVFEENTDVHYEEPNHDDDDDENDDGGHLHHIEENNDNHCMVLEGLKPHPNLKRLEIHRFNGLYLPTWLKSDVSLSLPNLIEIELVNCNRCQQLPALGQLPLLKFLKIQKMDAVKHLGYEFYGLEESTTTTTTAGTSSIKEAITAFPSLEKLTIEKMFNLKEWVEPRLPLFTSFPCLKELIIKMCPVLTNIPILFSSIKDLKEVYDNDMAGTSMVSNNERTSLTSFEIVGVCLIYLLRSLVIWDCPMFQGFLPKKVDDEEIQQEKVNNNTSSISLEPMEISEDLQCVTSIKEIEIGCLSDELNFFPFRTEEDDDGIKSTNIQQLFVALQRLKINGKFKLKTLPEQLKYLTKLKELEISNLKNMVALPEWLGDLSSLQSLKIMNCRSLMHLPSEDVMRRFTALEKLTLNGISDEPDYFPAEGIQHLISLRTLEIHGWSKLKSLPHQLQHLTNLKELKIQKFDGLVALPEWLGNLSLLQHLAIWFCENLMHLPSKEVMQGLTNLRLGDVHGCPYLAEQWSKKSGSEWEKIYHINPTGTW